jgi:hypothetical protein
LPLFPDWDYIRSCDEKEATEAPNYGRARIVVFTFVARRTLETARMKTLIFAKDMELIALEQIRDFPGAEYVISVHIERAGDTWALIASAKAGADLDRIQHAVRTTEHRLQHRYKLRPDW